MRSLMKSTESSLVANAQIKAVFMDFIRCEVVMIKSVDGGNVKDWLRN